MGNRLSDSYPCIAAYSNPSPTPSNPLPSVMTFGKRSSSSTNTFPGFPDTNSAEFASVTAEDVSYLIDCSERAKAAGFDEGMTPEFIADLKAHPEKFCYFQRRAMDCLSSSSIDQLRALLTLLGGRAASGGWLKVKRTDDPVATPVSNWADVLEKAKALCPSIVTSLTHEQLSDTSKLVSLPVEMPPIGEHMVWPGMVGAFGLYTPEAFVESWRTESARLAEALKFSPARFIVVHVSLCDLSDDSSHANMIVYDKIRKAVSYIEPNGYSDYAPMCNAALAFFRNQLQLLGEYPCIYEATYTLAGVGQATDPSRATGGMCATWAAVLALHLMLNPQKSIKDIIFRYTACMVHPCMLRIPLFAYMFFWMGCTYQPSEEIYRRVEDVEYALSSTIEYLRNGSDLHHRLAYALGSPHFRRHELIHLAGSSFSSAFPSRQFLCDTYINAAEAYLLSPGPIGFSDAGDFLAEVDLKLEKLWVE